MITRMNPNPPYFSCFLIGEGSLPIRCAELLLQHGHQIYGVISDNADLCQWAEQHNLPVYHPNDDLLSLMTRQPHDYLFSIVNRYLIPNEILALPRHLAINYHDAPLPTYAGGHATSWAIMNREVKHGITWHIMTQRVDAGDILKQHFVDIAAHDTALTLNAKCYEAAIAAFGELIDEAAGPEQITPVPQNLAQRTYFGRYKRPPAGGVISWQQSAEEIDALCRALTFGPYPNALGLPKLALGDALFIVVEAEAETKASSVPAGTIVSIVSVDVDRDWLTVATTTRNIIIKKLLTLDGQTLHLSDLVKQYDLRPGKQLSHLEPELRQQLRAKSSKIGKHESFWCQRLATLQPLEVPYRKSVAAISDSQEDQVVTVPLSIPNEVMAFLKAHNWQPPHFLCAVFALYLARLSDVTSFDIGFCPSMLAQKWSALDGLFASQVPWRVEIELDWPFERLYQAIEEEMALIRRHKTYARDVVVRYPELKSRPELQHIPLSSVTIACFSYLGQVKAVSDLTLCIGEQGTSECGLIAYHPELFLEGAIERMVGHLETLMEAIVATPKQPIMTLPLLTEAERHQILVEWNDTATDYASDKCIHELFAEQAERTPDAIAVVFPAQFHGRLRTGEDSLTYRALNTKANQLAHYLQSLGVGPETLVGITIERSLDMVVGLLAILKAGGAYLPLDPTYPSERLALMLQDSAVNILLSDRATITQLPSHESRVVFLDSERDIIAQQPKHHPASTVTPLNLAYVIYTSGSTGKPKGTLVSHRGLGNLAQAQRRAFGVRPGSRVLQFFSLNFDGSIWEIIMALCAGGTLVLAKRTDLLPGASLVELLREQAISHLTLVPSVLAALPVEPLPDLQTLIVAGEACPTALALRWSVGRRFFNAYGPTETTVWTTLMDCHQPWDRQRPAPPIGRAIDNVQLYILDKQGQPVPIGVPGELHVGGISLARGYLNRPTLTEERFIRRSFPGVPNPFADARLYKTGDLVRYLPNGTIEFMGRIDHQVKIRGFRIELGEIESALSQHPTVREMVVVARDSGAHKALVAYIVPAEHASDVELIPALRTHLLLRLPDYMVPAAFVLLDHLPLTPNGKIDRKALPAPIARGRGGDSLQPRTPTEEVLVTIWAEVLGISQVGIRDNFFELGGHSLLATQVISRMAKAFELNLPIQALFENPTIAQFAEQIEDNQDLQKAERPPIEATPRHDELPLSYAQQRLWFLEQLEGPSPIYNVPTAYRLTGRLQVTVLEQAIHEIIRRHEVLRTAFGTVNGQPVQKIERHLTLPLEVYDLKPLTETEQRAELNRLLAEAAKRPFNLAEGPLLRVTLYQLGESEQLLLLNMHHIISDGWSLGVWWQELDTLYRAFAAGKPSPLPELFLQYADFAQWQRSWLTGEVLEKQLAYWQAQLAGVPTLLELPTDHARPPVQTFNGRFIHFEIAPQLAEALRLLGRRTGTTLFMSLYGAFAVLLSRYSRQEDIVIGTSIANRHYQEIEPLIGFFVNTLPLRTDLSGNPTGTPARLTFEQLLHQVRQITLDAYAHQDIPFEHLVGELVEERNLSHPPLFQVMFELQDAFFAPKSLGGLSLELLQIENATAKFDMNMMLFEGQADGSLAGILEYNTDLFEQATMQRMIGHYLRLLESIAENAQQPINQLPLLTEAERQQLLVEWNDTAVPCPTDTCFHQLFEAQVARTPDAEALVYSVAAETLTYRELNERANQVAHHLRALGVKPEVVVGVCMERCTETVISLLAIFKAGGVYIPLDPALPQERLSYMLTNSAARKRAEAKVVLTKSAYVEKLSSQLDEDHIVHLNRDWEVPASSEMVARQPKTNLPNLSTPQNLAYVIYTSGSTGLPKGAMIEHQGMVNHLYTKIIDLKMSASDRLAETAPQSFDISIWQFLSALLVGGAVHIFDDETVRNPAQLLARTEAEKITILEVVPSLFRFMLDEVGALGPNRPEFCALRWLMLTGEALPPHLCREWFPYYPDIPLMNAYGPTECSDDVTHHAIYEAPPANAVTVPIGRAVPNMRLYILDPTMQPVPIGVPGELYVGGIGVGRGYLNDPERTANAFMDDPFSPPNSPPSVPPNSRGEVGGEVSDPPQNWGGLRGGSGRFYKTGDLVRYRPDGTIEFLGRLDHQVKIRGHRIELGEIEGVLAKHPAVRQSLVIAKENGPADYSLVAYVALNRSNDVSLKGPRTTEVVTTVTELRHYLSQTLPDYMIPAAFVTLDAFPLTPNGKVNRQALPEPTITSEQESYLRPQTQSEEVLANIWAEVLGVERVLRSDNFFELGGHSLLAIQVISRLRDVFQVELSVRHVFESPTVAELAQTIESARQTEQQWPVPPPIQATERTGSLPLSFAQQRLWFIDQFEGPSGTYNIPFAFRLTGKLQQPALQQAINALVQRHEVLRTTFPNHLGQPIQQIHPDLTVPLTVVDLQQTATSAQPTAQLNHLLNEEAVRPFDLASGPLLRMILYVSSQTASVLLVNIHHIIADDWSIGLLMSELDTLYQAAIHAKPVQLPALPVQYADFAQWQREWLTDSVLEPQLAYWQQQLADAPTLLNLPTDHPRPSVQTFNGQIEGFELDPALSEQLRTLSRQAGTSLFMTLYGAFAVLLSRYSGQEDLVIGTPIANRNYREVEPLIGFFLNTLPLRTDLSGNPSFADLLKQVRQHTLDAYAHQDIPFEQLVDELAIERSLSHSPLFQVAFAWLELAQPVGLGELKIDPVGLTTVTSRFDLTLLLTPSEEAGAFTGMIEYNTDLFELATIRRMIAHFQQLLTSIVADPAQSINQLPLLTERERQQLLVEWNATQTPYPAKMCIHDLFSQQAERTPNAVAVTFAEQQLTYQQLNEKANQLAHHLVALGVGPEVLVGICLERSIEMVVGLLGILKAGGAYVPLDPTYPVERLAFMLSDTNVRVLLSQEKLVASLPPTPHVWCLDKDWAQIADEPVTNLEMDVRAENLAYVMYTSGSTGRPKGVSVPHRAVVRLVRETTYINFGAEEIFLQLAPISFDAATLEIWGPLLNGGQLVVMPPGPPSLAEIGTAIQRYGITTLWLTSGLFHLMVDERLEDLQPLRQLLAGGDVLSVSHVKRAVRELSNCQVHNGYGPTENTTFTCCYAVNDPQQIGHSVPIGKPIANTQVYILDERMQPVPIGVLGELYTGGAGLARGYHNRDELTAQKFVPNPYGAGRLYRTGDLARYLPDGNIQFAGRIDNQIKLRGFRIELGEIEAILSQHPAVQQTTVIAREDQPGVRSLPRNSAGVRSLPRNSAGVRSLPRNSAGVRSLPRNSAGEKQLVAYVVTESEGGAPLAPHASANDLRTFLKKNLPDYMVPSTFMLLESLPLNPNGKVNRRALPAPDEVLGGLEEGYIAPRTPTEEIVAAIWAQVLGRQRVSRDANFFDLGGHSLLATQVISRLREAFRATPHASCPTQTWGVGQQARRVALPVRTIFEAPTVAELAEAIESARQAEQQLPVPPPIQAIERVGDLPLSFAQLRLWFLAQITGPDPTYSLPMVLRLSGSLQVSALEQALGEIVRRHDILRTSFPMVEGEPVQRINPDLSLPLPVVSLQHLAEVEQTTELNRRLASEAVRPFDLAQGPLLRVGLYVLSDHSIRDGNYALFLNMHHIISDGWSLGVLWQELDSLYQAFAANQPSGLPELSVQYADFAHWQREWLQGEVLEKQLTYWQQQLANAPTLLELPTDRARNAVQTFNGQVESFEISAQLADQLRLLSRRSGTSLFMSLYGAFSVLLGRLCGQEDLVIGTPIANRNYQQIEPLIGFFVNTLPLRADLSGNPSFLDLLGRVRQMTLDAYTHQDIPFEQLVDELAVERQLSHTPLFQVVFMWQNEALTPTKLGDLTASLTELDTVTAKFDLTLALEENQSNGAEGSGLHGAIEYNTDLFDQATIKRMIVNFKQLLTGIVADPTQSINQLPILTEGERHQLLVEWNATQAAYPQTQLVHQLVEAHAEQRPEAQAVVYPAPGPNSALTYRELNQRANQLAHYLRKLDVGPEVIVAVYMERSVDMLVGYLAILKAGGAYTPIDANYPATRVDFILSDTQTPVLLTHSKLAEKLARSHCRVICLDRDWPLVAQESQANPEHITSLDNIAYVIYTSGSTGQPKGSQISHNSLLNFIFWYQKIIEINKDDRTTQFSGLSFDVSVADIWSCLSAGATLYLPLFELLYAPSQLRDWIVTNRITKSFIVTPVAENLLGLEWPTETALEILATGGQKLHRVPAPHHPFKLFNMYGPSECTIVTAYCLVPPNEKTNLIPPIGRPVDNTQLYIVDRHMQPVPIGVVGELYIAGDSLARGYLNRPALTAERFIPNPFSDQSGARLYRTGDLVRYLASGEIEFLGRTDHQVKIRGFRIELGEIETVLAGHPQVQLATAMVYEQTPSDKRLVAYLVPARDQAPTPHTLREYLKQRIPEYMVPSAFVLLESLPLTPNGKVNRRALPAPDQMQATADYVSPQSDLEKAIATVWQDVLGLPRVGIHDNFFDVGGHSLLAVQIQSKLQASLDTDLTITDFFAYPTIASLAEQLSSKARLDKAKIGQAQQTQPEKASWEANQSRAQARRAALKQRVTRQPRRRKR